MKGAHFFSLNGMKPQKIYPGGSRLTLTSEEMPILNRLSLAVLTIAPGHSREPHWHPNAGELGYSLAGNCLMTVFSPGAQHDTFTLNPGDLSFVPKGYIHHIANVSDGEAKILLAYNHQLPEDLDLSASLRAMSNHVLAATFGTDEKFFAGLKKGRDDVFITDKNSENKPAFPSIPNRLKVNIEGINPQIISKGGSAKIANSYTLPTLEEIAMFSLRLSVNGVREPHWHPNANELNYVIKGRARVGIVSPGNEFDIGEVGPGEGSFIPASYFHHIENIGDEEMQMAVFFSHSIPNDIGISGALSAYSNEQLAAVFKVPVSYFKDFKRFQEDRMVVAGGG